jgi:excinuclease ABC subunit C
MKTFRLELCNKKIKDGCLQYHIGICAGSCRDDFDKDGYLFRLHLAMNALRGHYKESLSDLRKKIAGAALTLDFEKAARFNYYLQNLDTIFATLKTKFSEKKYGTEIDQVTTGFYRTQQPDPLLATALQDLLNLSTAPRSIDCFDVSHFQGNEIVGSCIRFLDGVPQKDLFRRFKIKTLTEQNDYAALQEIVARRYRDGDFPDLILIDGGKGQRNAVAALFPERTIISLAKREERIFSESKPDGILLDKESAVGKMLIRLRDYAHHFAITYHRSKRQSLLKG